MSETDQPIEWFLARDGQQHGPISAAEMTKIIELGYLLPTDLVWRFGQADWQPASQVLQLSPQRSAPPMPPAPPPGRAPDPGAGAASVEPDPRAVIAREAAKREEAQRRAREEEIARRQAPAPVEVPLTRPTQPVEGQRAPSPRPDDPRLQPSRDAFAPAGPRQPMPLGETPMAAPAPASGRGHPQLGAQLGARIEAAAGHGAAQRPVTGALPLDGRGGQGQSRGGEPSRHSGGPGAHPATQLPASPAGRFPATDSYDDEPRERRRFPWGAAIASLLIAGAGGGVYALHKGGQLGSVMALVGIGSPSGKSAAPRASTQTSTQQALRAGYPAAPGDIDASFQKLALWQILKRDFPDWYRERISETAKLKSESKPDIAIAQQLAEKLVQLRRLHVQDALAASPSRLRLVASSFLENLERLAKHSTDACYGFISQGETNPLIVELMRASEHSGALQAQAAAVFQAISEGRKTPLKHAQPTREDYDKLAAQLSKRGWSPADLQLFSDARALSRATPERVCKMVQDWFAAQLAVGEEEVQVRLLIEALKPVVAG